MSGMAKVIPYRQPLTLQDPNRQTSYQTSLPTQELGALEVPNLVKPANLALKIHFNKRPHRTQSSQRNRRCSLLLSSEENHQRRVLQQHYTLRSNSFPNRNRSPLFLLPQ
jgi:hypothetical protein